MKRSAILIAACGVIALSASARPVVAAEPAATTCTSAFFQVIAGQLAQLDPATGQYLPLGQDLPNYNAMGFRVDDGNLYAIQGSTLLRIDQAGTTTNLGTVAIVPGSYTGDFGDDGLLHVSRGGADWFAIDVDTLTATRYTEFSVNRGVADIVNVAGVFYGASSNGHLWAFDPVARTSTDLGAVAGLANTGVVFGAAWATAGSNLYVGRNSGEIYQISGYSTGAPVATQVATSPATNSNDGASCPYAAPPAGIADVDGATPEVAPTTPEGIAASLAYQTSFVEPQFVAPDAGLGTGAACDATVIEDQPLRDLVTTVDVETPTVLYDNSFVADSAGFSVLSGSWLVESGSYRQLNTCEYDLISVLTPQIVDSFDLDVTFSSPTGPNHGGVVFNVSSLQSRSGAIVVDLADDGSTLRWGRYDELGYYQNIGWDLIPAPAPGEPVTLRIESRGSQYTIIHNGNIVTTETTSDPGGMVGLIASRSEVDFSSITLTAVPS